MREGFKNGMNHGSQSKIFHDEEQGVIGPNESGEKWFSPIGEVSEGAKNNLSCKNFFFYYYKMEIKIYFYI